MRIVVKLTWGFVFILISGNVISSNIANTSPDY